MIFRKIRRSFNYALAGLVFFLQERNMKIHILVTFTVVLMGIIFSVSVMEWIALVLSISLVISFEIINTVIENVIDLLHPHKSNKVMIIKDLAAAAVFISAIASIIIGTLIFLPYFL